ncbi:glycoprotein antigen BM86-like isoform X2 [Amblyomma americanum]
MRAITAVFASCCLLTVEAQQSPGTSSGTFKAEFQDICSSGGNDACGSVPCELKNGNASYTCRCDKNHFFNATDKRCYHLQSCMVQKCERGRCEDQNGTSPATCRCDQFHDLTEDCKVKDSIMEQCAKNYTVAEINVDNTVSCQCPPHTKLNGSSCQPTACLNATLTCHDVCRLPEQERDERCCQKWDSKHCDKAPEKAAFCEPGFISTDPNSVKCKHICETKHANEVCQNGCNIIEMGKGAYYCKCGPGEELAPDGVNCIDRITCTEEMEKTCTEMNKSCVFENKQRICKCHRSMRAADNTCTDTCTQAKIEECTSLFGKCEIMESLEDCSCQEPLRWLPDQRNCVLEKSHKYAVSFKTATSEKTTVYAEENCLDKEDIVRQAMQVLYGQTLHSVKLQQCSNEYKVRLDFTAPPDKIWLQRIQACENPAGEDGCFFPPSLYVLKDSISEVTEEDLCDPYLREVVRTLGNHHKCEKIGGGEYALKCSESHIAVTSYTQGALHIDLCIERNCDEYCKGPERMCLEGKCVCHLNYFQTTEGTCVPLCSKNPCKNRGVCETSERISYYCRCQPSFTGPNCEIQLQEYIGAQRNVTIVGVLLGVLIVVCLGISAAIIRRMKNKNTSSEHL